MLEQELHLRSCGGTQDRQRSGGWHLLLNTVKAVKMILLQWLFLSKLLQVLWQGNAGNTTDLKSYTQGAKVGL